MSLYKQLWLAVIFLLTLVFSGTFIVTSLSAKNYLEEQLRMKNADNATALALSLTQQGADQVLLELTLAAQFDTGFYELIQLADPEGNITISREDHQATEGAPGWFMSLFQIEAEPGVAAVQQGWQQMGTITLRSHTRFAYGELWQSTQKMALLFLVAMVAAGLLGNYLLKAILRPLSTVVEQAQAIGERRFVTIEEPKTLEFKKLVSAMNVLSDRIRQMLQKEAKRLEKWQREAHIDSVTKLLRREPFMQTLDASLHSDDVNSSGSLSIIRLAGLAKLNELYGRKAIDSMLKDIGSALNAITLKHSRWAASRLNGADFALLAPRAIDPTLAAKEMQDAMIEILQSHSMLENTALPGATTSFEHNDKISELLTRLDGSLQSMQSEGESHIGIAYRGDIPMQTIRDQMKEWRSILEQSFQSRNFRLIHFPVVDLNNELIHHEAPLRLEWDGKQIAAGKFLPWINRLEFSDQLDRTVIELALADIANTGEPVCANLSVASVVDSGFIFWLSERLGSHPADASKLWLEVPESMAFRHFANFKKLCSSAKSHGSKVGIEHVGHQLSGLGDLHDVGIDYLKVDAAFTREIDVNVANQTLLRTLCTVGHSIGVIVIAEGVRSQDEWDALREVGFDGATGPGISLD